MTLTAFVRARRDECVSYHDCHQTVKKTFLNRPNLPSSSLWNYTLLAVERTTLPCLVGAVPLADTLFPTCCFRLPFFIQTTYTYYYISVGTLKYTNGIKGIFKYQFFIFVIYLQPVLVYDLKNYQRGVWRMAICGNRQNHGIDVRVFRILD